MNPNDEFGPWIDWEAVEKKQLEEENRLDIEDTGRLNQ